MIMKLAPRISSALLSTLIAFTGAIASDQAASEESPARVEPLPLSADTAFNRCDGNTIEMNFCLRGHLKIANDKLDETYKALHAIYSSAPDWLIHSGGTTYHPQEDLRRAQEAWAAFRKEECERRYNLAFDGTIRGINNGTCQMRLTMTKLRQLEEELQSVQ